VNERETVKNWNLIASELPERTNKDCRKRWIKIGREVNKGPWSKEEDDRLRNSVEQHGTWYVGTPSAPSGVPEYKR
jgi:Myb-like DNA-binding domain